MGSAEGPRDAEDTRVTRKATMAEATPDEIAVGTMVGEYRLKALLGVGGFGSVYRATHPIIGKSAAIKVIKRELSSNAEMVSRFLAEARAVNQIRHGNIIDIFAFGCLPDGRHYYVMELLDGVTLDRYVKARGGKLTALDAIVLLRPLARALHAAHARGIAHRDLKPENVFVCTTPADEGSPMPKLLDFGIAKLFGDVAAQHRTQPGVPLGTPAYMAPEQVHGRATDHRADIYTFGVLVFELLTGELPFDGKTAIDVMMKHASQPRPRMSSREPSLPAELDEPVLRMMAMEPQERPDSLLDAMDELVAAAERSGLVPAKRFSKQRVPEAEKSAPGSVAAVSEKSEKRSERPSRAITPPRGTVAPGSRKLWFVVAAVGAVGAVLLFALSEDKAAPVASSPPSDPAPAAPASTVPVVSAVLVTPAVSASIAAPVPEVVSSTVKLSILATPPDAEVLLGKTKLGRATDALVLPRGTKKVRLIIAHTGFTPRAIEVVPDHDLEETVRLTPAKKEYTWD